MNLCAGKGTLLQHRSTGLNITSPMNGAIGPFPTFALSGDTSVRPDEAAARHVCDWELGRIRTLPEKTAFYSRRDRRCRKISHLQNVRSCFAFNIATPVVKRHFAK